MNIVNKLTIQHLKQNKRRTLVTIFGVIISVAMIAAVTTLGVSFLDLFKKQSIANEGEWHVSYENVSKEQIQEIQEDEQTHASFLSRNDGYALLTGSENENKPYVFIKSFDTAGLKNYPVHLKEGRLPEASNEVVLSEHIETNGGVSYQVGDELTLQVGERVNTLPDADPERELKQTDSLIQLDGETAETIAETAEQTFKIVGMIDRPEWEPTWSPGYTIISFVDHNEADLSADVSVIVKDINKDIFDHAGALANSIGLEKTFLRFNDSLLRYYGVTDNANLQTTLYSLLAIIVAVIMIGSIALIYNAFAISVSERSRHLGMLSSVGATKRQKRNSVFFEGFVIALISIPLGIIAGLTGIWITFLLINDMIEGALGISEKLTVVITPMSIVTACLLSLATIFISTYLPAVKASKISAIDAIRQSQDVKLTGKKIKTPKLVRKLFGIEGEIGLKNLKRNKRRYNVTVFSLVISILLFLSVSYFTDSLKKSLELSQEGINFDIRVSLNSSNEEKSEQLASIKEFDLVESSVLQKQIDLNFYVTEEEAALPFQEDIKSGLMELDEKGVPYYASVTSLDEKNFKDYAEQIGAKSFTDEPLKSHPVILVNTAQYEDAESGKFVETEAVFKEIGDSLSLFYYDYEQSIENEFADVTIVAQTNVIPMGVNYGGIGGVNLITTEAVFNELVTTDTQEMANSSVFLRSSDPLKLQDMIEDADADLYVYNLYKARQEQEQLILILSVFTYGFIALITMISVANIFNTISTSVSLRKREFAMLKSVGMTPMGFNKMISYESLFYGLKSLLYGLPLSFIVMYLIYYATTSSFEYTFEIPWMNIIYCIISIFLIVGTAMLYSIRKVNKDNIIESIKQENI
ncbi:ABC transporter permease [Bacillus mesophilum]|uniref:FtsX-like permease family protein n=1 Tax=Bacillus mesophilum TaxID=1071718 RepID=A0A7V7RQ93_9BACI|nr:FtsX-like permease family protein [Bacillus mesophilum]KAB2335564.1 FtsX-like permease family protein [Bacillus mesophilum]